MTQTLSKEITTCLLFQALVNNLSDLYIISQFNNKY